MLPKQGLWRQTPPAIFSPIMGFLGLGLAWRQATATLGAPPAVSELLLGAGVALYAFALVAWLAKPLRRPRVLVEELRVLPGRAGLSAMTMSLMLTAAALVEYSHGLARWVAIPAFAAHVGLALLVIHALITGPTEARGVTPVWHLSFVGFIAGPLVGVPLGHLAIAEAILWMTMAVAVAIWAISLHQLVRGIPPAPLRPLVAIHLAPASFFATVAALLGFEVVALGFAALATAILAALLAGGRWIAVAGFSPMWGAFTFPLAAYASAMLHVAQFVEGPAATAMRLASALVLVAATLIIPAILFKILQAWARGGLAARTNAAQA